MLICGTTYSCRISFYLLGLVMKRVFFTCMAFCLTLMGCMPLESDSQPSAIEQALLSDSNRVHYHPVHINESTWAIIDQGNTLILKTGFGMRLKASARRTDKRTVLRDDGIIVANVVNRDNLITFVPITNGTEAGNKITIACQKRGEAVVNTTTASFQMSFSNDDQTASSNKWQVRRNSKRRLTLEPATKDVDVSAQGGKQLEVPFTALGTLIFNTDDIPLNARFALASYLASFNFVCEDPPIRI